MKELAFLEHGMGCRSPLCSEHSKGLIGFAATLRFKMVESQPGKSDTGLGSPDVDAIICHHVSNASELAAVELPDF